MKEVTIQIPDNYDILDVVRLDEDKSLLVMKKQEPQLPKSWEEFCEMFPIKKGECSIDTWTQIMVAECELDRSNRRDIITFPDRATAEAVIALCQLIQLRNCYNGDWVPDWNAYNRKFIIGIYNNDISVWSTCSTASVLFFKTEELRDEFLRNFRDLIEKIKPLYGIKEGGEK